MRNILNKIDSQHLYHGSSDGSIEVFEPRQAVSFGLPDDVPAIHATDELEPAIFMAVLGSRHVGGWGLKNNTKFGFFIIDSDLEQAQRENWHGYVYLLPKAGFSKRRGWEWISTKDVRPIENYKVGIDELPQGIHIMTELEFDKYRKANLDS